MSKKRSAEITARPVMIDRVFWKMDQKVTRDEVEKALKKLTAGLSAGLHGVTPEYLKMGGDACSEV